MKLILIHFKEMDNPNVIHSETISSAVNLSSIRTLDEIKAAYEQLQKEEEDVARETELILSQQGQLHAQLKSLSQWAGKLDIAASDATRLADVIGSTATLADRVSAKVKQLDTAKSRVSDCQQRVNDLIDLRLCSDGVQSALADEDYEQAAAHLHRFLAMDESSLKVTASEMLNRDSIGNLEETSNSIPQAVNGLASLETAIKTLHDAEDRVRIVIAKRFDEAVQAEDLASIERFFKLFPLINMHEGGLEKFTHYLCSKLVLTADKNLQEAKSTPPNDPRYSIVYADTLTLLFEGIARMVEIHQPLIETFYGPGRLITVMLMIQKECDKQSVKIIEEFKKQRKVPEKVNKVRESLYMKASQLSNPSNLANKIEAKDLDHILGEITLLQARSEMYFKFVRKRVAADVKISTESNEQRDEKTKQLEQKIASSELCHIMQELMSQYILLEDYFMTENIRKAIQHHRQTNKTTTDSASTPSLTPSASAISLAAPTTAMGDEDFGHSYTDSILLDDIFYIVKKCVSRAISSHNIDGVCAVANNASTILETDFCYGLLQSQLKMGYPSGYLDLTMNVIQTSFQEGYKMAAAQATGDSERQKTVFLIAVNSAENATDYITRLTSALQSELKSLVSQKSQHEKDKVENCLAGLPAVGIKLQAVLEQGIQQLRQAVVKPRIKPWVDTFLGGHEINEEGYADSEANDPFVQNLILNLDGLLTSFKRSLTPKNYDALVNILVVEVTLQLEKAVFKSKFSRLGGLLFDREVRSLVAYFTNVTTWSIRDKFSRLTQMATILNLESLSEVADLCDIDVQSTGTKLTSAEVRQVLMLRADFKPEEIKRIRL